MTTITTENRDAAVAALSVNAVANHADVRWDGQDAYDFIERVIVSFTDRLDNSTDGWAAIAEDDDLADAEDFSDVAHELADGAVPIYNGEIAGAWAGLQGWTYDEEVAEYGATGDSLQLLRVGLYVIALALIESCRRIAADYLNERGDV